jgi:hypothetical protein
VDDRAGILTVNYSIMPDFGGQSWTNMCESGGNSPKSQIQFNDLAVDPDVIHNSHSHTQDVVWNQEARHKFLTK